jgi:hypothetical protein
MANEIDKSLYTDYVQNCIKDIEKRANDMVERTLAAKLDMIRLVKERQNRDRAVIEDRFRTGVRRPDNTDCPARFRPGTNNLDCIKELFGDILLSSENGTISLKSIKSFECEQLSNASIIIPLDESNAWICDESNNFHRVNLRGFIETSVAFDFQIEHAAAQGREFITTSSELLAIKRLHENGTIKTEMSTSPLFPLGVHITTDGDICVCFVDKLEFSVNTKSRRLIMIYPHIGLIPKSIEYERGNRIFTLPNRVTSCMQNIIAIDVQSKTKSRIVCVTRDSKVLFEFTRYGSKQLCPLDICSTSNQEIIVLDEATPAIFVLSTDGILISTVRLSNFCISHPTAMAFNCSKNRLWIGHSVNKVSVFAVGALDDSESQYRERGDSEITNTKTEDTWF